MRQEAIYARQSLDKKDSVSIETQIDECRKKCSSNAPLLFHDKGYSGKNILRPELKELLKEIRKGNISKVVVYKIDRISRNIVDFYNLHAMMNENGCEICSAKEEFDTSTPNGRFMMGLLAVFAQMERENIQLRVKDNYYYRIQDGRWPGGPAPFGYTNAKTKEKVPTLVVNEQEIGAVRLAFSLYADSPTISLGKVARTLEKSGYKARKREAFDNVTIARMLQNPVYAVADKMLYKYYQIQKIQFINDEIAWNGSTSAAIVGKKPNNGNIRKYINMKEQSIYLTNISGIIDSRTFIRVQNRLKENQQIGSANKPTILKELAGKLKCEKCGYAVKSYSKSTNGMPYLSCYGARTLHTCDVTFKGLKFDELKQTVAHEIQLQLNQMNRIQSDKKQVNNRIYAQIKALNKEVDNLLNILAKSNKLEDRILQMVEDKQTQINELELKLDLDIDFVDNIEIYSNANRKNSLLPTAIEYDTLDDEVKKAVVNVLIDKILIHNENGIKIMWNI